MGPVMLKRRLNPVRAVFCVANDNEDGKWMAIPVRGFERQGLDREATVVLH
jgi:hypothetical protein